METHAKKKKTSQSGTLLVTFALGAAIGFSTCYALLVSMGWSAVSQQPPNIVIVPAPAAEPAAPATPEPETSPLYQNASDLDFASDLWVARHLFVAVEGAALDEEGMAFLAKLRPGGVVLLDGNLAQPDLVLPLVNQMKEALGGSGVADLPLVAVAPGEGQAVRFVEGESRTMADLGKTGDEAAAHALGLAFGKACIERGIGVALAPALDVFEPGVSAPQFEKDSLGPDRAAVTSKGLVLARGLMAGGVIPVVKHYPGLGAAKFYPATQLSIVEKTVPELAELMYPFAEAASQRFPGMMVGHAAVPVLEPGDPSRPASLSPVLLRQVVRDHWGFTGAIVAADLSVDPMIAKRTPDRAAVEALMAGCDAVVFLNPAPAAIHTVCRAIEDAVRDGRIPIEALDASKIRLDAWCNWLRNPVELPQAPPAETPPEAATVTPAEPGLAPPEGLAPIPIEIPVDAPPAAPAPTPETSVAPAPEAAPAVTPPPEPTPPPVEAAPPAAPESQAPAPEAPKPDNLMPVTEEDLLEPEDLRPSSAKEPEGNGHTLEEIPPNTVKTNHKVVSGETLADVAKKCGVTVEDLRKWNRIESETLTPGTELVLYAPLTEAPVPPPAAQVAPKTHRVAPGEGLEQIAAKYGTTGQTLIKLNNLTAPDRLLVGQELKLPEPPPSPAPAP